jgi:uncharacterized membrane protein|tara:strand:- start:3692 stop:4042 length:351 start_codon:yes stop_codon:yes gene_type:complete
LSKNNKITFLYFLSVISLIGLIFLNLFWEIFYNPLDSNGSWMVVKSLILLIPLPGILKKKRYTYQWSSMLIWLFIMEGIVRFYSELGISRDMASYQTFLGTLFFFSSIFFCRITKN